MITDRIGQHEVLIPINHNYNNICEILGFFINLQHKKFQEVFLLVGGKQPFKRMSVMMRTVLLHCPISAEIRTYTVDSQSDLRILLKL